MSDPYILRADGCVHTSDVRHVSFGYVYKEGLARDPRGTAAHLYEHEEGIRIITCSRDNTSAFSTIPAPSSTEGLSGDEIHPHQLFAGHEAFVNFALLHAEGLDFLEARSRIERTSEGEERQQQQQSGHGLYLITGSNDKHVLVWNTETALLEAVLDGHQAGVTCGDIIRAYPNLGEARSTGPMGLASFHGDIVTGDWAGKVVVFSHTTGKVKVVYDRHENAIRGVVHLSDTNVVVSVSGDKTIHCWDIVRLTQESINALTVTEPVFRILKGHEDVVQCVCAMGNNRKAGATGAFYAYVATGSNDCTVRVWAVESELKDVHPVRVLHGHDSLVYGLCFHPFTGELLSASEDRSVRVWGSSSSSSSSGAGRGGGELVHIPGDAYFADFITRQLVQHPCVVWSVAVCRVHCGSGAEGDPTGSTYEDLLITGGADAMVRLWTRNDEKFASVEKLEMLEEAIAAQKLDVKVLGDGSGGGASLFNLADLPLVEHIHRYQGRAEGEKKFFKNEAGEVEVYIWTSGRWDKIGVVVSGNQPVGVDSSGAITDPTTGAPPKPREKKLLNGKYYDYVFDVDVDGHMLKLPYNAGESVLEAAQNFINDHSAIQNFGEDPAARAGRAVILSQDHKEEIVNFIMNSIDPADIRRIPGLGGSNGDAEGSAPENGGQARVSLEDTQWSTAELVEAFNADGAQAKVNEFLSQSAGFANLMQEVRQLDSPTGPAVTTVAARLAALFAALPEGKKFPALDAIRFALAEVPQHAAYLLTDLRPHLMHTVKGTASFTHAPATDADALVWVRLVSNLLPALMTASQPTVGPDTARDTAALLKWAASSLVPDLAASSGSRSASVRQALAGFYLRNLSVLVRILLSRGSCVGREGVQAYEAFKVNTDLASAAAEAAMLTTLGDSLTRVLGRLLSTYADLAPLLMRSFVTVAVELPPVGGALKSQLLRLLEAGAIAAGAEAVVQCTRAALRL